MGIKDWFGRFSKRKAVPAEEIIEETTVEETVAGSEDPATAFGASETDGSYGEEPFDAEPAETAEVFEADEIIAAEPLPRLTNVDFEGFWHDTRESERRHVSAAPDYRIIRDVEQELGYKLEQQDYERQQKAFQTLMSLISSTGYEANEDDLKQSGMSQAQADAIRNEFLRKNGLLDTGGTSSGAWYGGYASKEQTKLDANEKKSSSGKNRRT